MNADNSFGPHLTVDLSGCPEEILRDLQVHFDFLNEVPDLIGMTKITQPYVFPYSGLVPEDRGITGVVVIAESHIAIHSFELKNYTFLDMFSCKPFDIDMALREIEKRFKPAKMEYAIAMRGKDFPRDASQGV